MNLAGLDNLLNPPGRLSLNAVIDALAKIEHRLGTYDVVSVSGPDLRTLLAAARYGRNCAEEEIARIWGSLG